MSVQHIRNVSLLDSLDALRNWRAGLLLLASLIMASLMAAVGGALARFGVVFMLFFLLVAWAFVFYGTNAVGIMMLDEARGHRSRPVIAAVMGSLFTAHRLLAVGLLVLGVNLLGVAALSLVLLLCKLPVVGPLLYFLVFPVGVLLCGLALMVVLAVVFPLSAPSVWSGASTMVAVSHLFAIARSRMALVLVRMLGVGLTAVAAGLLIAVVLMAGAAFFSMLSVGILGDAMHGGMLGGLIGGAMRAGGSGEGHAIAAMLGGSLLFGAAFSFPALVYLRGACAVYLGAIEGLDLDAARAALDDKVAAVRNRARDARGVAAPAPAAPAPVTPAAISPVVASEPTQPAAQAPHPATSAIPAEPAVAPAAQAAVAAPDEVTVTEPPNAVPAPDACPVCAGDIVAGDLFCAHCGHRLR